MRQENVHVIAETDHYSSTHGRTNLENQLQALLRARYSLHLPVPHYPPYWGLLPATFREYTIAPLPSGRKRTTLWHVLFPIPQVLILGSSF